MRSWEVFLGGILMILLLTLVADSVVYRRLPAVMNLGAYVHIPFCRRRCFYCNFPIHVIGDRPSTQSSRGEEYTAQLLREIDLFSRLASSISLPLSPLQTLYFGGGTPGLLTDACIENIIHKIDTTFGLSSGAEITVEMDPGVFDRPRLARLQGMGVSRLSIGVQAFDDEVLKAIGRAHNLKDVYRALDDLSSSKLSSFNIDLISALPGLSMKGWQLSLQEAIRSRAPHVSVYDLQVEERTAFGRWKPRLSLPAEPLAAEMFSTASHYLRQAGYLHYELSNYALPGHESKHNLRYWRSQPCLAFGVGAASYFGRRRFSRPSTLDDYSQWLERVEVNPAEVVEELLGIYTLPEEERAAHDRVDMEEAIMLALRTAHGLNIQDFNITYGPQATRRVLRALKPFIESGRAVQSEDSQLVRLSDPDGMLLSNEIISSVFAALPY
eukprot:gene9391-10371_t